MKSKDFFDIFVKQIIQYHIADDIDSNSGNGYESETFEWLLWEKSFIDTVQWHLEDLVRPADVDPVVALGLKRRIDKSNQHRTDIVERIDDWFLAKYAEVRVRPDAKINTETPAWAIDRLSILALKVYHFAIEAARQDASEEHRARCLSKLEVLMTQKNDLCQAIDELLDELSRGEKVMKVYRQMKMYNDPTLNPMLYKSSQ